MFIPLRFDELSIAALGVQPAPATIVTAFDPSALSTFASNAVDPATSTPISAWRNPSMCPNGRLPNSQLERDSLICLIILNFAFPNTNADKRPIRTDHRDHQPADN